jgi:serine/threonine protein kinase
MVIRILSWRTDRDVTQRFCREVMTWKNLRHDNVLPLIGVTMSGHQFEMVSEWMVNGSINEYVKAHKDADRFELVSFHHWHSPTIIYSYSSEMSFGG